MVTALDQKRNPRELGFAVQKLDGAEVAETRRFLNGLGGRVAGLTITPTESVAAGASSQIVLPSLTLWHWVSSLCLYPIIIMDNSSINESGGGASLGLVETSLGNINQTANGIRTTRTGWRIINLNDIETITVLKRRKATAIYGSRSQLRSHCNYY